MTQPKFNTASFAIHTGPLNRLEGHLQRQGIPEETLRFLVLRFSLLAPEGAVKLDEALADHLGLTLAQAKAKVSGLVLGHLDEIPNSPNGPVTYRARGDLKKAIVRRFTEQHGKGLAKLPAPTASSPMYPQMLDAAWFYRESPAKFLAWCLKLPPYPARPKDIRRAFTVAMAAAGAEDEEVLRFGAALGVLCEFPTYNKENQE